MPEPPPGFEWTMGDNGKVILKETPPPPPPGPEQMPLDMPPGMPPEGPMPPGGPPLQPDAMLTGPQGGGFPPYMNNQLEGENLGLPQDVDPMLLDQMLNTPGSDLEQLRMAGGFPPEGTIPGVV
jgi:hypothetical protein